VLTKGTKQFKQALFWQDVLKWLEVLFTAIFFVVIFWFFYLSLCKADTCKEFWITNQVQNIIVGIFFSVWGLLTSLRIGVVFLLNDPDPEPEYLFYLSLVGIFLSNLLFGLFFNDFVLRAENNQSDTPSFIALILVLMTTVGSLLLDKQTWDKSTAFVKIRISMAVIELVVLLINPYLGIILAGFILPIAISIKGGLEVEEDSKDL
jgi:hypothetical protein